jgi:ATP-dependent helicase HrpA
VILATNVAETSLTLPGIVYVIDTGVARIIRYDSKTGTTRLQIEGISQASADQRKGRCGRVREGICIRLYDETSFLARAAFTDPEIKRTGLAGVILRMKALELGEVETFPFLDPPRSGAITEGYRVLEELGALDDDRRLTELGRQLAKFPVDPRIARMILASVHLGCLAEVLIVASALGLQDPRERPHGLETKADSLHRRFVDERSDFLSILRLFNFVRPAFLQSVSQLRKLCKENFLSFVRVREWFELHQRLEELVREHSLQETPKRKGVASNSASPENSDALHQALLAGLLSRVGLYQSEHRAYQGARQTRFVLHPSSGLAKSPPAWVMAYELVQTSQMFARMAAKIEPTWLDLLGSHLMTRKYSDPHWSEKSARASVREHATLFGLPVLKDRSVDYATIAPEPARMMFLEHALVRGEYRSRGAFQEHNRNLFDEIARLRDKARQSDLLFDDSRLLAFFDQRVPPNVVNGKTFEAWRENAERENPRLLYLSFADVFSCDESLDPRQYPDEFEISGVKISASYVFDPTAEDDGITLYVPLSVLPQLEPQSLDHTIPAWHERKIAAIVEELPRVIRQKLGRISELIPKLVELVPNGQGAFLMALSQALFDVTGVRAAADTFPIESIPAYLRFNYRIIGERNLVIAESRHLRELMKHYGVKARALLEQEKPPEQWCRKGMTRFDIDELPEFVTRTVQGVTIRTYPALMDRNTTVELALLESSESAEREHRNGVRRLLMIANQTALQTLSKRIGAPLPRRSLLPPSKNEIDHFRQLLLTRVVNEAFCLQDDVKLPRTKVVFERMQMEGGARLMPVFETTLKVLAATTVEYEKTLRALEQAAKIPSALAAAADIKTELEHLLFADFLAHVDLIRLGHYPRYLRAAQARLARAIVDPRKDATKAAPFKPLWQLYLNLHSKVLDQKALQKVRFSLAELRVTLFAPELKAAESVSTESVQRLLTELR